MRHSENRSAPGWFFLRQHWTHWLALGLGTGLAPVAPGTVGTLVGFVLFALLWPLPVLLQWGVLLGLFVLGVPVCERAAQDLQQEDPGSVVWDEIVAFALVLEGAPHRVTGFILAFLLFRLFDIWKPFPIRWVDQRVRGGWGIMLDDLLAALYALLVLHQLQGLLP